MLKKGHSEEQIQGESEIKVSDICREHGISDATSYIWKNSGLGLSELRELRQLREENAKLKRLVADLSSGPAHSAGDRAKKSCKAPASGELGLSTQAVFALSGRRAAQPIKITGVTLRYRSTLHKTHCGGACAKWRVNPKRIYRLYTEDGLTVRTKLRKKIARDRGWQRLGLHDPMRSGAWIS